MPSLNDRPIASCATAAPAALPLQSPACPQAFDFESGLAIFNGVHAALGFLPVIPGPCGLFRADAITASMLEDVRLICTNPSTRDGIIQGNLKIAEDRILSYLLLLMPGACAPARVRGRAGRAGCHRRVTAPRAGPNGEQFETHWVPSTVFFFESEDALKELVPQRRRWLNGTVAGYLWLLTNSKLWRGMFSMGLENDKGKRFYQPRLMPWKVRAHAHAAATPHPVACACGTAVRELGLVW